MQKGIYYNMGHSPLGSNGLCRLSAFSGKSDLLSNYFDLAYSYCADYHLLFAYPENIKAGFMWGRSAVLLPWTDFLLLHGQSKRVPFTLHNFFRSTGNRNAFLLPCSWLFTASRAIEAHSFYPKLTFSASQGNRTAFLLPCS